MRENTGAPFSGLQWWMIVAPLVASLLLLAAVVFVICRIGRKHSLSLKNSQELASEPLPAPLRSSLPSDSDLYMVSSAELSLDWSCLLGVGQFGRVYSGVYKGQSVAVKCLQMTGRDNELLQEARVLSVLPRHANVLKMFGVATVDVRLALVVERMECSLQAYLKEACGPTAPVYEVEVLLYVAVSVAEGMRHLHRHNVLHRDLASRNILLGPTKDGSGVLLRRDIKVADFGLARLGEEYIIFIADILRFVALVASQCLT
jgi:tRNA A-37 threonylcarbamoyl transferase component Bud32